MSATKRGAKKFADDFYATEAWVVERFLEKWVDFTGLVGGSFVEPGAGEGAIIRAVNVVCDREELSRPEWTAVEINPAHGGKLVEAGADHVRICDLLTYSSGYPKFTASVGNPAFSIAREVIEWSRANANYTALLLRLDFLGSAKRAAFLRGDMPDVYVLPNRPSFAISAKCDADDCDWAQLYALSDRDIVPMKCPICRSALSFTTTDSCDYAWFTWSPLRKPVGQIRLLEETPADVRSVWGAR